MLELIFQGFAEWIYGMILEVWGYFCNSLLDIMSLDFAYIKSHAPVVPEIMQVLLAVGWALLLGNLVFQAAKSMLSGLGFESEDPQLLFARTFVFSFLLLASPQICELGLNLTSTVIDLLQIPDAVNVHLVDGSLFGSLTAAWLLVIIFDVIIMLKVLKLLLEVAERYVILAMLTITAPLAFAMGGSRKTSDIFTGWCRMYGSMCLLMCTNVIFFKMLLSVVSTIPSGLDVLPWFILILSIVKVAKKADEIITRIGLNPAITGNDRGSRLPGMLMYMVFKTATAGIGKAIGGMAGGVAGKVGGSIVGGLGASLLGGLGGFRWNGFGGAGAGRHASAGSQKNPAGSGSAGAGGASDDSAGSRGTRGGTFGGSREGGSSGSSSFSGGQGGGFSGTRGGGFNGEGSRGGGFGGGAGRHTDETAAPQQKSSSAGVAYVSTRQTRKSSIPQGEKRGTSHVSPVSTGAAGPAKRAEGKASGSKAAGPSSAKAAAQRTMQAGGAAQAGASTSAGKTAVRQTITSQTETKLTQRAASVTARSGQAPPGQPGTAGTAAAATKTGQPRHGRNTPSASADGGRVGTTSAPVRQEGHPSQTAYPSLQRDRSVPARQESRPSVTPAAPAPKGAASTQRPGTAGTAAASAKATKSPKAAIKQSERTKTFSKAMDGSGKGRGQPAAQGQRSTRKTAVKPPDVKGGGSSG